MEAFDFILFAMIAVVGAVMMVQTKEIWVLQAQVRKLQRRLNNARAVATSHTHAVQIEFPDEEGV